MNQVRVVWDDARSEDGWVEQEGIELRLAHITTLGWLVQENDAMVCVASSKDEFTGQVSGLMYIPKQCITSIEELA